MSKISNKIVFFRVDSIYVSWFAWGRLSALVCTITTTSATNYESFLVEVAEEVFVLLHFVHAVLGLPRVELVVPAQPLHVQPRPAVLGAPPLQNLLHFILLLSQPVVFNNTTTNQINRININYIYSLFINYYN